MSPGARAGKVLVWEERGLGNNAAPKDRSTMTTLMEEIAQQPVALSGLRKYYSSPGAIPAKALRKLVAHWPPTVVFTGMGSSLFAAYPAQAYLTGLGIRALVWETAELLHHHRKFLGPDTLLVVVSQSGETVEIIRLLDCLPQKVSAVAVANVETSTVARRGKLLLPMMAGRQTSVSTKTYTCAVAVLMYLALAIARKSPRALTQALMLAIEAQEKVLDRREVLTPPTVEFFNNPPYVALMSRGADMASAYQGALMFKEVVRLGAEPISAAQFRHGPIEIINPKHRYVIFARQGVPGRQGKAAKLLLNLAGDIRSHGGRVLLYADLPFEDLTNVRLIEVAPMRLGLGTLVDSVHIQLLAHDLALRAGLEPGRFHIAAGVTREEEGGLVLADSSVELAAAGATRFARGSDRRALKVHGAVCGRRRAWHAPIGSGFRGEGRNPMDFKRFGVFAIKVIAAHVTTYFLVGAVAYPLLTKEFYTGPNPIFATFMCTQAEPELWSHVVRWFLPAQILRGMLIAAVFYPLFDVLQAWSFMKRWLFIASLYVVLGFWAATVAAPGTIEGMLYMRPFITPMVHLKVQPEIVLQGLGLAFLIAGAMMEAPRREAR